MGIRNSIKLRMLQKNLDMLLAGCSCHLAHLVAGAGGQAYQGVTDLDMEDHQAGMYYFFKNSTRCKGILLKYLEFMGQEDMSRFVQTQWLCLENCCKKEDKKFHLQNPSSRAELIIVEVSTEEKLQPRRVRIRINRYFLKNLKGWAHNFFVYNANYSFVQNIKNVKKVKAVPNNSNYQDYILLKSFKLTFLQVIFQDLPNKF